MHNTRPELQIEVERLTAHLTAASIGETITYSALRIAAGGEYKPWTLIKARQLAERETGLRLATVHGVGIKKLSATDVVGIGKDARARISKIAKRQAARLSGLQYNDIAPAEQKQIDMERSLLGAISAAASITAARIMANHESTGPEAARTVLKLLAGDQR